MGWVGFGKISRPMGSKFGFGAVSGVGFGVVYGSLGQFGVLGLGQYVVIDRSQIFTGAGAGLAPAGAGAGVK